MTGPFVLRMLAYPKYQQLVPDSLLVELEERAPKVWSWAHAVVTQKSVLAIWDEDLVVRRTLERIEKMKSAT
jgi:glutathione S-transferase